MIHARFARDEITNHEARRSGDFLNFDFSHFTPQVKLFFVEKELEKKPKIFEIKNAMQKGMRKILTFVELN